MLIKILTHHFKLLTPVARPISRSSQPRRLMASRPSAFFIRRQCRLAWRKAVQRRYASTAPVIYDVVTVGGGPVGLALLTALKSSPVTSHLRTALVETQDLRQQRQWKLSSDQFSHRASSLTPSSVEFLESMDAWRHVDLARVQPYNEMQVWDAANDSSIQFDWKAEARQYNAPTRSVATMTENANLTKGLLERIHELEAEQSLLMSTKVSSIQMGEDEPEGLNLSKWPVLSLKPSSIATGSERSTAVAARLLVGADGFNSPVRTFAGINSHGWDYNRHGVVATLRTEPVESADSFYSDDASNQATAFQRFLPQLGGPIAVLPLPNNHASLVWSTTPSNAAYLRSLSPCSLVQVLNAALRLSQTDIKYLFTLSTDFETAHESEVRWRLQHTPPPRISTPPPAITGVQAGSVASFPLRFRHATTLTAPRVALVGDAAHTIHPLAGQGLNLGLADAKALADTIAYSTEHGMDIGDSMALERYGSERFGKSMMMAGGVDALNWLYQLGGNGQGIMASQVGRARGIGMAALGCGIAEQIGVKGAIMRMAEGS